MQNKDFNTSPIIIRQQYLVRNLLSEMLDDITVLACN